LYIVNFVSIFFNSQVHFILRLEKELRRATSASKITINKRKTRDNAREARETKVETRKIETSTKTNAKVNTKATTTTTTTTTNKKQLSKLCKQFICTYVSFVFEITLILLSCLLLFNNLREYTNNTLYN